MKPALKPAPQPTKPQPRRRGERLSKTFWKLAQGTGVHTQSNEPVDVVKQLLAALGGLEGKRSDSQVTADALSFLLRLEDDPRYASPEQTRGGEKDRRALVFSLGVLLFERLTGHHPFVESLSPVEAAVVRDRCGVRGANNLCSLPGELRAILAKALSPFPEDRYDGVAELRAVLIRFVANATLSQARASGSPPLSPRPRTLVAAPTRQKRPTPPPCPGSAKRQEYDARRREIERLRSTAPISTLVEQPSPSTAKPTATAAKAPRSTAARPGLPAAKRRATPTPTCGEKHSVDSNVRLSQRKVIRAVFALGAGAFVVLVATLAVNWPGSNTSSAAAVTTPAVATPSQNAEADEPAVPTQATPAAQPSDEVAPTAAGDDEVTEPEVELPPDVVASFDPEVGGQPALESARDCFSDSRLGKGVELGVSLRYGTDDGLSNRVYLAPDHDLDRTERRCIKSSLVGLAAGGQPERPTIVTYSLFLSRTHERFHAHVSN